MLAAMLFHLLLCRGNRRRIHRGILICHVHGCRVTNVANHLVDTQTSLCCLCRVAPNIARFVSERLEVSKHRE